MAHLADNRALVGLAMSAGAVTSDLLASTPCCNSRPTTLLIASLPLPQLADGVQTDNRMQQTLLPRLRIVPQLAQLHLEMTIILAVEATVAEAVT